MTRPHVVLLRGHGVTPWELRPWELLLDRFDITVLVTGTNRFDSSTLQLSTRRVRALRDLLPRGRVGDLAVLGLGDRYLGLGPALRDVDVVHALELGVPWSGQPAVLKQRLGFKLVLTVWETIPLLDAYRYRRGRRYRRDALAATDLFLPTTERARQALLLEGAAPGLVEVSPPGIDTARFASAGRSADTVLSIGRLVWEKGHQDVLRALASIRRGPPPGSAPRLLIVGSGPERQRLERYAGELGVSDLVSFETVPYQRMPEIFARASCLVLASLATPVWEEQFGMVLAEAMAAGVPIVASSSGAIPAVVGDEAVLFAAGDWPRLAQILAAPLPPARQEPAGRYSLESAASRLASAYERVLED